MRSFETQLVDNIPTIRRFAWSLLRCRAAADDLVQETLERALRKRHLYRPIAPLESWLIIMMRRCAYDRHRLGRSDPLAGSSELALDLEADCRPNQIDRIALIEVGEAMARLDPARREALLLCGALELSNEEAAARCSVPTGTIKSRLSRARGALRSLDRPER